MKKGASYDTRFLVELYYTSDLNQKSAIRNIFLSSKPNYLSTAVLSEIYKLTLEREGKEVAELRAKSLANDFHLIDMDEDIAVGAALIRHKKAMPFADSIIASTARVLGVPCYTDDPHFNSIDGVAVRWIS